MGDYHNIIISEKQLFTKQQRITYKWSSCYFIKCPEIKKQIISLVSLL